MSPAGEISSWLRQPAAGIRFRWISAAPQIEIPILEADVLGDLRRAVRGMNGGVFASLRISRVSAMHLDLAALGGPDFSIPSGRRRTSPRTARTYSDRIRSASSWQQS